jgi:hypothetical protein
MFVCIKILITILLLSFFPSSVLSLFTKSKTFNRGVSDWYEFALGKGFNRKEAKLFSELFYCACDRLFLCRIKSNDLKNKHININWQDESGNSLLHCAVANENSFNVEILINSGASVDLKNGLGQTPLHYAVMYEHYNIAKMLLNKDADKNIKDNFDSRPVMYRVSDRNFLQLLGKDEDVIALENAYKNSVNIKKDFDYSAIWPPDTNVLFIGESHIPDNLKVAETLIRGLIKSGVKLTHYATEFITVREQPVIDMYQEYPIPIEKLKEQQKKHFNTNPLTNRTFGPITEFAKENNLKIVGLDPTMTWEDPGQSLNVGYRNAEWVKILSKILDKNPDAKILVYCGAGHSDYDVYRKSYNRYNEYNPPVSLLLLDVMKNKGRNIRLRVLSIETLHRFYPQYFPASLSIDRYKNSKEPFLVSIPQNRGLAVGADFFLYYPKNYSESKEDLLSPELTKPSLIPEKK